jgi:hypothetical protein
MAVHSPNRKTAVVAQPGEDGGYRFTTLRLVTNPLNDQQYVELDVYSKGVHLTFSQDAPSPGRVLPVHELIDPKELAPIARTDAGTARAPRPFNTSADAPLTPAVPDLSALIPGVQKLAASFNVINVPGAPGPVDANAALAPFELPLDDPTDLMANAAAPGAEDGVAPLTPQQLHAWSESFLREYEHKASLIEGDRMAGPVINGYPTQGPLLDKNGEILSRYVAPGLVKLREFLIENSEAYIQNLQSLQKQRYSDKVALGRLLAARAANVRAAYQEMLRLSPDRVFNGDLAAESGRQYYENAMIHAANHERLGAHELASEMLAKAESSPWGRYVAARDRFTAMVDVDPLLGLRVDGVFVFEAIAGIREQQNPTNDSAIESRNTMTWVNFLDKAYEQGIPGVRAQVQRFRDMTTLEQLAELASPRYAGARQRLAMGGPPILRLMMAEVEQASKGAFVNWISAGIENALASPGFIFIPVLLAVFPVGIALGLALTAYQLAKAGSDLYVTYTELQNTSAIAPVAGFDPVIDGRQALRQARKGFAWQAAFLPLTAAGTVAQVNGIKLQQAQKAQFAAIKARNPVRMSPSPTTQAGQVDGLTPAQRQGLIERIPPTNRKGRLIFQREDLPQVEDLVRQARRDGVSNERIAAVLDNRPTRPGHPDYPDEVAEGLSIERANARGLKVFVAESDAEAFQKFAQGTTPRGVEVVDTMVPYAEIQTKAQLEAAGKPQVWTTDEANLIRASILPNSDELASWWMFESGFGEHGLAPVFSDGPALPVLRDLFGPNAARRPIIVESTAGRPTAGAGATLAPPRTMQPSTSATRGSAADTLAPPGTTQAPPGVTRAPPGAITQAPPDDAPRGAAVDDPNKTLPPPGVVDDPNQTLAPPGNAGATRVEAGQTALQPPGRVADPGQTRNDPGQTALQPPGRVADAGQTRNDPGQTALQPGPRIIPGDDPNQTLPPPSARGGDTVAGTLRQPIAGDPNKTLPPPGVVDDPNQTLAPPGNAGATRVDAGQTALQLPGRAADPGQTRNDPGQTALQPPGRVADAGLTRNDPGQTALQPRGQVADPGQTRVDPGQTLLQPPGAQFYRLSDLYDPLSTGAQRLAEEGQALQNAVGRARLNGGLTAADGAMLRGLAGENPAAYFRSLPERGFVAELGNLPVYSSPQHTEWMPIVDADERRDLERYWNEFRAGNVARDLVDFNDPSNGVPPLIAIFKSLGRSSGNAFEMTVLNRGSRAVKLSADSLVLEPIKTLTPAMVDAALAKMPGAGRATSTVEAYCLEFLKLPPGAGMMFRLASPADQQRYSPIAHIFEASRELRDGGQLRPAGGDPSDPADYFEATRQWAIWTREQSFDERGYTRAFVEHSRKNLESAGRRMSPDVERAIASLAPARWADIQLVLREAANKAR